MASMEFVKENRPAQPPLSVWWIVAGLAANAALLAGVALLDAALPEPLGPSAPPERFHGLTAHRHLTNLTAIGPRVAGSYENEVLAVGVLVAAVKDIAAHASPHNRLELDVQTASGAFALSFMDGMNNVYRDVQNVVVRVRGAGGRPAGRSALLLNCHFDTVPDSPGASDDGAGCAVLLGVLRALAAARRPLRHDAVFLFNGAEENILQASHAFITQHKWARDVRAFINIEACGAGGREVLFQAGPHDPWIVEMYASVVPHPYASSLAQELFESGLIPADTDFRIFRDFGNLSGVDLAWSSNGYVYHTRLDAARAVPPAALQRTGDNVLALAAALLASPRLDAAPDAARQPVFFDVLGQRVLALRAPGAAAAAAATLALVLLKVHANAGDARARLYVARALWWRAVARAALCCAAAHAAGLLAAALAAALLAALDARLAYYSRPLLLAPLFALPALAATLGAARRLWAAPALLRGWWGARAWHDAATLGAALLLLLCWLAGLRSGFLPLLWALPAALADLLAGALRVRPGARAALWALGAALPAAQTTYLALGSLQMFVPLMGRAGSSAVPADVTMALLVAALAQACCSWLLAPAMAARGTGRLAVCAALATLAALALAALEAGGGAYSAARPQRLMVFHTRRTLHAPLAGAADATSAFYWVPDLDANTRRTLRRHVPALRSAREVGAAECARLVYCGAPYFLPVRSLVPRSLRAGARSAPRARLRARLQLRRAGPAALLLRLRMRAPAHAVLLLRPARGARLAWTSVLAAPRADRHGSYFLALHAARAADAGAAWDLRLRLEREPAAPGPHWGQLALAGHAQFGPRKLAPPHADLLAAAPDWLAATGWGVDLHIYQLTEPADSDSAEPPELADPGELPDPADSDEIVELPDPAELAQH